MPKCFPMSSLRTLFEYFRLGSKSLFYQAVKNWTTSLKFGISGNTLWYLETVNCILQPMSWEVLSKFKWLVINGRFVICIKVQNLFSYGTFVAFAVHILCLSNIFGKAVWKKSNLMFPTGYVSKNCHQACKWHTKALLAHAN